MVNLPKRSAENTNRATPNRNSKDRLRGRVYALLQVVLPIVRRWSSPIPVIGLLCKAFYDQGRSLEGLQLGNSLKWASTQHRKFGSNPLDEQISGRHKIQHKRARRKELNMAREWARQFPHPPKSIGPLNAPYRGHHFSSCS